MGRESLAAIVEARLDETAGERQLDLCLDVMRCECPKCRPPAARWKREILYSAGGVWDRVEKSYVAEAATSRTLTLQAAQLPAARWFARWLRAHQRGQRIAGPDGTPAYTLALVGGRRGGKSDLGVKALPLYLVTMPRAIGCIAVPVEADTPEVERVIEEQLPAAWYRKVGLTYYLANGGELELLSGYDPDSLKRGRYDIALIHEAQKHQAKVYAVLAAAAADRGGLVLLAANPPDTADGEWVADLVDRSRAGKTDEVVFEIDPRQNPHVDHRALAALAKKLDERTYAREVLGQFLPREDTVFHAFSPSPLHGNVRELGRGERGEQLVEVTRTFLARKLGAPADRIHGFDFQWSPHMAAVTARFFEDPDEPAGDPLIWFSDGIQVEQADEDRLLDAMERRGDYLLGVAGAEIRPYGGADPVVIDASGEWQDAERTKGRASADVMRRRGWRRILLPDERSKKNPLLEERFAVLNGLFRNAAGKRKAFVVPQAVALIRALKLLENRNGAPNRRSDYAHICDAASYLTYRLFPRRAAPPKREIKFIPRIPRPTSWEEAIDHDD